MDFNKIHLSLLFSFTLIVGAAKLIRYLVVAAITLQWMG